MSSEMSSQLAVLFPPEIWDPIINAITTLFGPLAQSSTSLSAVASSLTGLF